MTLNYAGIDDEDEVIRRFNRYKKVDPFPSIPPSLLNGADIADYVAATAMVCPFYEGKLKSGSYEAAIFGTCYWWDDADEKQEVKLEKETDRFELKPNSLVYVQVEPTFRLPDYIALRFNLKISHVHRGILLGTGPLIDPGYEGKLLIPLHNFSNNSYMLKGKEALIWIEFTKLSPILHYKDDKAPRKKAKDLETRKGAYVPFLESKKHKEPDYYFDKANEDSLSPHPVFFSSVKEIHRVTNARINDFQSSLNKYKKVGIGAIVAAIIAILGIFVGILNPTWSLINDVYNSNDQKTMKLSDETKAQSDALHTLKAKVDSQQHEIKILRDKLEELSSKHVDFSEQNNKKKKSTGQKAKAAKFQSPK